VFALQSNSILFCTKLGADVFASITNVLKGDFAVRINGKLHIKASSRLFAIIVNFRHSRGIISKNLRGVRRISKADKTVFSGNALTFF